MKKQLYELQFDTYMIYAYVNRPMSFKSFIKNYIPNVKGILIGISEAGFIEKDDRVYYPEVTKDGLDWEECNVPALVDIRETT
jgi:hypothetical protein